MEQRQFTFNTRRAAKAEAERLGASVGDYEIARDPGGYFIAWINPHGLTDAVRAQEKRC